MAKEKDKKITVIIPMYNAEKYIGRCLDSILNQTFGDYEVLIIDDGSTDRSGQIADTYAESDERIKVIHTNNGGVSRARNIGLEKAKGEYLSFIDSDDAIMPDMFRKLYSIAKEYEVDVVTSDLMINNKKVSNNLPDETVLYRETIYEEVLPLFSYPNSIGTMGFTNKLFRREILDEKKIRFYEGFSYQEDLMFMINVYANISSLYYVPEAFYIYEPLPSGLYSLYRMDGGKKFIEARKNIISIIKECNIPNINWGNFNLSFLYNICFYIYRTSKKNIGKEKKQLLINEILNDEEVINCCIDIRNTASSFDKRIANAVANRNVLLARILINFVYSGKAGKLQNLIGKVKNRT